MDSSIYTPSAWGSKFHALTHDEALGAGSAGVGKSVVLRMEPLAQIFVEHERCRKPKGHPLRLEWGESRGWALYLRRTYGMLQQSIAEAKRVYKLIDPGVEWLEKYQWLRFSSGYTFQFGHCQQRGDWEQYFSNEYTIIMFDELIQFLEEQYENIKGRCRTSDPVLSGMLKVRAMSNPVFSRSPNEKFDIDDPFWVRKYFVDPAPMGGVTIRRTMRRRDGVRTVTQTRIYFPGKLTDNPNEQFRDQYEARLLAQKEHVRRALLDGDWYYMAGQYFTEVWNLQKHTVRKFEIPSHWKRFRSMDWGYKKPGCVHWWAVDPDGNLWCEREYTFKLKTPQQVAKEIKRWETKMGLWEGKHSRISGPADTQCWEQRSGEKTIAAKFLESGVPWVQADKRSRKNNAMDMYQRMADDHDGTTTPGFMVFAEQCPNLLRTIPMLPSGPNEDPDEPGEINEDHWLDSAFYACAYASNPLPTTKLSRKKRDSADDEDDDDGYRGRPKHGRGSRAGRGRHGYGQPLC